ncbi:MAG: alpha/beta hydrolase [Lautropia sp.]|nr:alpha/beta hydrolase [Lautropia sp.]
MNPNAAPAAHFAPVADEARDMRPLLILLHGTRMNAGQWVGYDELLGDLVVLQTPDLPGHGLREAEAFSLDGTVADIEAWVEAAGDRPVVLGGHSLGGYAAMCYAERHPQRLKGLVLMGSAAEPVPWGAGLYRLLGRCWEGLGPAGMQWLDDVYFARVSDARVWAAIRARGGQFRDIRAAWEEVIRRCRASQLAAVRCPVLVMGGGLDQLHLHARRFADAAPKGRVVTSPWRTHLWPMSHPDEVAAALRQWLLETVL